MGEPITSKLNSLFIQVSPDEQPEYFGCADLGDLPEPLGDRTPIYCRDKNGKMQIIGSTQGQPAMGTTSITAKVFADADVLDRLTNCDFTLYAVIANCGKRGIFANYTRVAIANHARLTQRNRQNFVKEEDTALMRVFDISYEGIEDIRAVVAVRQTIAETTNLNDIVFDLDAQCAGDCGAAKANDDDGFIGSSGAAASPPSDADVWLTTDKGTTWANATGGVPSPFAGGDIISMVRFQIDKDNWRLLVASGPKAGNAQVAYSDDEGATWTTVTVGSTAWEGAGAADALFAFDRDHIWFATDHGRVYESTDAGVTWTSEASALTASGARALNAVKFADYLNGYAAGNTDTLIVTNDGGDNWTALTPPTTSDNINALAVLSKDMLLIGSNAGQLWKSLDGGAAWTALTYTGQAATDTVKGFDFVAGSDLVGWMIVNTVAPLGSIHRTVNGGMSWEKVTTPVNGGLNAVFAIDENTAYAVGNVYSGTGVVIRVAG